MEEKRITEGELSLYYRVHGEGAPVMLLHGFGEDSTIWDAMIPGLASKYRLIIPDHAGSGKSTGNLENLTMDTLASHAHLIAQKEGLQSFTMIGHSMGGYVVLAYAEKYPDFLNKFGLFHSTAYADSEEKKEGRKKNMDFIEKHGAAKFQEQTIPNLFSEETRNGHPGKVKQMIASYSNFSDAALVSYTAAMMNRPDRTEVLKTFNKPILFIMGELDTVIPIEQGLKQCRIPEFSYIYIAARSGHLGMLEEPEFCLEALQFFLSGN